MGKTNICLYVRLKKHLVWFLFLSGTHLKVFSSKQLHPHDGEDEPEDETDQQDVEDARDGLDEGIDHDLRFNVIPTSLVNIETPVLISIGCGVKSFLVKYLYFLRKE